MEKKHRQTDRKRVRERERERERERFEIEEEESDRFVNKFGVSKKERKGRKEEARSKILDQIKIRS